LHLMSELISRASSAAIVSNRASWLQRSSEFVEALSARARAGGNIEIFTRVPVDQALASQLAATGVQLHTAASSEPPKARFTLINADRSGAEQLAIATGVHPEHEVLVFDSRSGPQIIALAKDITNRLRTESRHAASVE